MNDANTDTKRDIRSFVIRSGRMTESQRFAYEGLMRKWALTLGQQTISSSNLFDNDHPLTVEIGFGMGDSLAQMALANPNHNFIGIEVHRAGVGRLLHLIEHHTLTNLRVYCDDAVKVLTQDFAAHTVNRFNLFFPDPWHKTRHHKRRLIQQPFLDLVATKLVKGGILHIATDWKPYVTHVLAQIDQHPRFFCLDKDSSFVKAADFGRPETKFERRGIKLGHGVWDMVFHTR